MEKITTASRIHPLMAAAALSVITISAVGTAAIAGLLPNSHAQSAPAIAVASPAQQLQDAQRLLAAQQALTAQQQLASQQQLAAQPLVAQPLVAQPLVAQPLAAQPLVAQPLAAPASTLVARAPQVEHKAHVHHVAPRPTRVVYRDAPQRVHHYSSSPNYQAQAPAPQPRQPNYVGIGTGAVIGGLLGHQVGGGNGRKLATVAGIIGGGYLGNEIANRNAR